MRIVTAFSCFSLCGACATYVFEML
jgi:hypothetical protein